MQAPSPLSPLPVPSPHFPVPLWCIIDGKPGHEQQTRGLIGAIARLRSVDVRFIAASTMPRAGWDWMRGRFTPGEELPSPQLIIAAGHGTHAAALAARRATGGRLVVLMRPTLPLGWFDLCLVPEHDLGSNSAVRTHDRVVTTTGVLNTVRPSTKSEPGRGLLLIGGPSKHHGWDAGAIVQQVQDLVFGESSVHWTLTTSRRTPNPVVDLLFERRAHNLDIIPYEQTQPGWVASRLAESRTVFVSEDSVSMIYEALSAAADVGLLAVPRNRTSRVIRGVDRLVEQRAVIPFSEWQTNRFEQRQPVVLQEADRCARVVCERLLDAA